MTEQVTNTLAYYDTELIMAIKDWKVQKGVHSKGKLLALTTNIKIGWK
jgi:hypothetical protein